MTTHKTILTAPTVCTVGQLREMFAELDDDAPVNIAIGQNEEGGLDVAPIHSVTTLREPLQGGELLLIVPSGAMGKWFEEVSAAQAAIADAGAEKGAPS